MKKLIVAICAVLVAVVATARTFGEFKRLGVDFSECTSFGVSFDISFDNGMSYARLDMYNGETGFSIDADVPAEDLFKNVEHISKITVMDYGYQFGIKYRSMTGSYPCYQYEAKNLAQAVKMFIQFARDTK